MDLFIPQILLALSPVLILLFVFLAARLWQLSSVAGARSFSFVCFSVVIWLIGDFFSRLTPSFELKLFWECFKYLGVSSFPVLFIFFAFEYKRSHLSYLQKSAFFIIPAITNIIAWSNQYHHLLWKGFEVVSNEPLYVKFGAYFWYVHMPFSYTVIFLSMVLLIQQAFRSSHSYRKQVVVIVFAVFIPLLINVSYNLGLTGGRSYAAFGFSIFILLMVWGFFSNQFLEGMPIAYETVFRTIKDSVMVLDNNGIIIDINPAAERHLGRDAKEVIGQGLGEVFRESPEILASIERIQNSEDEFMVNLPQKNAILEIHLNPLNNKEKHSIGKLVTIRDITSRKNHEQMLENIAFQDYLTKLSNRYSFQAEAERSLEAARKEEKRLALLYFDLDNFKAVNDKYGHDAGDELLKFVGARASSRLRKPDFIARLGGDEFVVLLHDADEFVVNEVVNRILNVISSGFRIDDDPYEIKVSVGAALYPADASGLAELMRCADAAMYRSKARKGKLSFYADDQNHGLSISSKLPLPSDAIQ